MPRVIIVVLASVCAFISTSYAHTPTGFANFAAELAPSFKYEEAKFEPYEEEKSCCDKCWEASVAAGNYIGGAVCCCEDDSGDIQTQACSFADKYPTEWPPGPGQDIIDDCIMEHEEGHIDEGEGVCIDSNGNKIADGNPSVWGAGQNHDTCEPNQYEDEIDCLQAANCNNDRACERLIKERIKILDAAM